MGRNRLRLFSVLLDCFAPAQPYEEDNDNNIQRIPAAQDDDDEEEEEEETTEDFEQGVHITVQRLAAGSRQVKCIKFSREVFSERQAKLWWEENRVRVREHYASPSTSGN